MGSAIVFSVITSTNADPVTSGLRAFGLGVLLTASALAACAPNANVASSSVGNADASVQQAGELPCAVDSVLAAQCRGCHGSKPSFGAPMPLVSLADLHAPARSDRTRHVYELVQRRIHDDARPMPQAPNPRLTAADAETLDAWVARGAPKSEAACGTSPADDGGRRGPVPVLPCPTASATLAPGAPFSMPAGIGDLYVYYGVDVAAGVRRHITAITPIVQNTNIVHHMLLMQVEQSVSPIPTTVAPATKMRLLFGWAPGGNALTLPANVGFPEEGTAHYVVQIHYSNLAALSGQTDASGFATCTGAPREHEADVMAFGTETFTLPARARVAKKCTVEVPADYAGLTLFAAMPHQHQLGASIATTLVRGAATTDLGTRVPWNFQNQEWTPVNAVTQAGDKIVTRCEWVNGGTAPVSYGENTQDEMCYSFTLYYPRRTAADWSWNVPANASTCVDD